MVKVEYTYVTDITIVSCGESATKISNTLVGSAASFSLTSGSPQNTIP